MSRQVSLLGLLFFLFIILAQQLVVASAQSRGSECPNGDDESIKACIADVERVEQVLRQLIARANGKEGTEEEEEEDEAHPTLPAYLLRGVRVFCDEFDPVKGRGLVWRPAGGQMVLRKNAIFLRLPLGELLNAQTLFALKGQGEENEEVEPINHLDALVLLLILMKRRSDMYASVLPKEVMTGFRLSEEELERQIKDPELIEEAIGMREMVYERARELVDIDFIKDELEYVRAVSVVQSRVFTVRMLNPEDSKWVRVPSLVPIADMMNLSLEPNADCHTNDESTYFECFATKDIQVGDELLAPFTVSPGNHDANGFTLFHYGFQLATDDTKV